MAPIKIIAAIIIAAVIVAGVGAFFLLSDNDDEKIDITGRLQIFGNADNNDVIDEDDIRSLEEFKDSWDKIMYPYADANLDGTIDDEDINIVKKIIAGETVDINYINGLDETKKVTIPINSFVIAGSMIHPIIEALDAVDKAVGKTGKSTSLDPILCSETIDLPQVGPKAYEIDIELLSEIPNVDAVITLYSSTYADVETVLEPTGISCIRVNTEAGDKTISAYLLLGVLLGCQERAQEIVGFYDDTLEEIENKLSSIPLENRKTTLSLYSYSICGTEYYLTNNTISAGGINLSDFNDNTKSVKENREWAAEEKYQAEYLFEYTSFGWGEVDYAEEYNYYGKYFTFMNAYPNKYICINKDLPDITRIAYVASILYPEVFGEDYGDKINQDFVSRFYSFMEDYDVTNDGTWVITYDMI